MISASKASGHCRHRSDRRHSSGLSALLRWLAGGALVCLLASPADALRADKDASPAPATAFARAPASAVASPTGDQIQLAQEALKDGVQVDWHDRLGTPRSIRGEDLSRRGAFSRGRGLMVRPGASSEQNAVAVLDNLSGIFKMRDAAAEFTSKKTDRDRLGFQHVKLTQVYQGLRVIGGELIVHFNSQSEAYEVNGQYVPDIALDTAPGLSAEQAVVLAQNDLAALGKPAGTPAQAAELVIFAFNTTPRLAYELMLTYDSQGGLPGRWRYWIDAQDGGVIARFNDVKIIAAPTSNGVHTNITGSVLTGEGGGSTNITGWCENTNYYYLYNKTNHWSVSNAATSGYTDNRSYAYRTNSAWGTSDRTEISAANNFHNIQQYYASVHSRNSFDNSNTYANADVHYGTNYANAYWDGTDFTFGDGDGSTANSLAVLDVCGHEFGHAVTEYSANLFYGYCDSGALNESFSDIFGTCIEFRSQPDGTSTYPNSTPGYADWLEGEDICISPYRAIRDLRNPAGSSLLEGRHPTTYHGTYWNSSGEMHYNSTVQSYMFYLLCQGGSGINDGISYSVTGIGLTNAEQIAYRVLTVYCTPYTDYSDARNAWISAARDLNSSWVACVEQAWSAVGISADVSSSSLGTAVDWTSLTWYTGGTTNSIWFAETTNTHDGADAAQSGAIRSDEQSRIHTTVTGPGTLSFWWKVSSETNYDFLRLTIDTTERTNISGSVGWQYLSFSVSTGTHVLKWTYTKDSSVSQGLDAGWLDGVTFLAPLVVFASSGTYADKIAISWISKDDATAYEVWRAQGINDTSLATLLAVTTATTYNDTSATPGIVYYYWIKARTPSGTTDFNYNASGWRSWLSVPTGVSASDGTYTDKVRITWTAASNAASYIVYRNTTSSDTNATTLGNTTSTTYDDTTATADVTYYYWVKGVDGSGYSSGFSLPDTGWRATAPQPDPGSTNPPVLRATDFQMSPSAIQVGSSPTLVSVRISNTGTTSTSTWLTLTVYLSSSGVFGSANNPSMGSVQRYVSLAASQSADLQLTSTERSQLRVPGTASVGYYTVFLKATTADAPNATNNVVARSGTLQVIASQLTARDDFDGDGITDLTVYQESTGNWIVRSSSSGGSSSLVCGGPGYAPVSGDFDGDSKADFVVYQESAGTWLFRLSGSMYASATVTNFGGSGYTPVLGDFDGDGKADPCVYQESTGLWKVMLSASSYTTASARLGGTAYSPVSGDFDGDDKADPAVYQESTGTWLVMLSGSSYATASARLGGTAYSPVSGDFDGDGKSDPAIYQAESGYWAVMVSGSSYATASTRFGETGYRPVSGDFDGDGKTDLTLYNESSAYWFFRLSKSSYALSYLTFGGPGYRPVQ